MLSKRQICEKIRINAQNYFCTDSLAGWCGLCSVGLSLVFAKNNHTHKLCIGQFYNDRDNQSLSNHAWIECNNKIYDITAEQFNGYGFKYNDIHIGKINDNRFKASVKLINPNLKDTLEAFRKQAWPSNYITNDRLSNCLNGITELDSFLASV